MPLTIVNSLLCFLRNFRNRHDIRTLVERSFSLQIIAEARHILEAQLSDTDTTLPSDIIDLFDIVTKKEVDLEFVAGDLTVLPLTLTSSEETILREIKDLRSYFRELLEGKVDDSPPRDSTPPSLVSKCKLNASASSPEFPLVGQMLEPPPIREESPRSPSSPSDDQMENALFGNLNNINSSKRKVGRSLDATVKKLSERIKQEESEPSESPTPSTPTTWQPTIDPQAYLNNMIKIFQNNTSNNPVSNFSSVFSQMQRTATTPNENEELKDDEDGDSSPSPSEERMEDYPNFEMSIDCDSDKPFVCEHFNCGKRFANKFLLKKHQFIHTGLRPHTCPYCSKRFNRKDNLLRHKKTHIQNNDEFVKRAIPDNFSGLFSGLVGMEQNVEASAETAS